MLKIVSKQCMENRAVFLQQHPDKGKVDFRDMKSDLRFKVASRDTETELRLSDRPNIAQHFRVKTQLFRFPGLGLQILPKHFVLMLQYVSRILKLFRPLF